MLYTSVATSWRRQTNTNVNNGGFFGSAENIQLAPGETALRSFWNIGLVMTLTNPGQYPPGSSILRVGLLWDEGDLEPLATPTPISQGDDADWMDIETLAPYSVVLASSVDNIWQINWAFPKDEDVKSMRKNGNETGQMGLYVCWEFALDDEVSGFTIPWWYSSTDCLVNTPPA